jgi:hypothetical protein
MAGVAVQRVKMYKTNILPLLRLNLAAKLFNLLSLAS